MFLTTIFKRKKKNQQSKKEDDEPMRKYVYFLQDSPQYPNEIMASSIDEVKSLILDSIGADNEGMILNIVSAEEYYGRGKNPIYSDINEYSNTNDFFNSVINSGKKIGAALNREVESQQIQQQVQSVHQQMTQSVQQAQQTQQSQNVKYFEDNGIKYKLENGILYKNNWVSVNELSDKENYRIVNNSTNKVISSDKYRIEKLDWKEI